MITRRDFVVGSSAALTLGTIAADGRAAWAQTFSVLELEAKGPLDDIAMGSASAPVTII